MWRSHIILYISRRYLKVFIFFTVFWHDKGREKRVVLVILISGILASQNNIANRHNLKNWVWENEFIYGYLDLDICSHTYKPVRSGSYQTDRTERNWGRTDSVHSVLPLSPTIILSHTLNFISDVNISVEFY